MNFIRYEDDGDIERKHGRTLRKKTKRIEDQENGIELELHMEEV